jgi:ankyrin repeat protein
MPSNYTPSVSIRTPDAREERKRERERSERKSEKKLMRMILSKRAERSDDEGNSPIARKLQFGDEPEEVPATSRLWSSEQMREWFSLEGSKKFLERVVGSGPRHVERFTKWSGWDRVGGSTELPSSTAVWIRELMRGLVMRDLGSLKRLLVFVPEEVLTARFGEFKRTIMHAICMHDLIDYCMFFLRKFKLTPVVDKFGMTPLHFAVLNSGIQKIDTVQLLVTKILCNAQHVPESRGGATALHLFCSIEPEGMSDDDIVKMVDFLRPTTSAAAFRESHSPLLSVVTSPWMSQTVKCKLVACILALGGSALFERDNEGFTALHLACSLGLYELVSLLVPSTFPDRVMVATSNGVSPLHVASTDGTDSHAKCILKLADSLPNSAIVWSLKDFSGWNPLMYACHGKYILTATACLGIDSKLVCPEWGRFPQLVGFVHNVRGKKIDMQEISDFMFGLPDFASNLNSFLSIENNIKELTLQPLTRIVDDSQYHSLLNAENKLRYLRYKATEWTRHMGYSLVAKSADQARLGQRLPSFKESDASPGKGFAFSLIEMEIEKRKVDQDEEFWSEFNTVIHPDWVLFTRDELRKFFGSR